MSGIEQCTLTNGPLRFSARAMGAGPVALCLHGFPDTLHTFDALLPALAEAGFRGVAVAMRGYEPQSQPADGDYHAVRLAEDVSAWVDQLGVAGDVVTRLGARDHDRLAGVALGTGKILARSAGRDSHSGGSQAGAVIIR